MLLFVSIASISVVSTVAFIRTRDALKDQASEQLIAARETLASEIETYFRTMTGQARTLGEDQMVVQALIEFDVGWDQLNNSELEPEQTERLDETLVEFQSDLAAAGEDLTLEALRPEAPSSAYLQYQYLSSDVNNRAKVDDPGDGSFYSRAHRRYHPTLRNYIEEFGYYDLFLVDNDGEVVYSVQKEMDYATSLATGPYRNSGLARLFDNVMAKPTPGRVVFVDYSLYQPWLNAPAAFVASPVTNLTNGDQVGVIVLQLPVDEINRIMTNGGLWNAKGYGDTGEAYAVGADLSMRSQARPLIQEPDSYSALMSEAGYTPEQIGQVETHESTVLAQPVDTVATRRAFRGQSGTTEVIDYLGRETLSSYRRLELGGLDWAIVSQVDMDEANSAVSALQRDLLVATGIIVLTVTALSMLLSSVFVRPIRKLIAWADEVRAGNLTATAELNSTDEFGELAGSFNQMVNTLREQNELVERQNQDNENLLLTIMPPAIAHRLKAGEERIADDYPNVAVVHARITGFVALTETHEALVAANVLNDLITAIDYAAERAGIEKIKTVGARYIAASGLMQPRLDQRRRSIEFAIELRRIVDSYDRENNLGLGAAVGLSTGRLEAGVIGKSRPVFEIWGSTPDEASALANAAAPGEILAATNVTDSIDGGFSFSPHTSVVLESMQISCQSLDLETDPAESRA